MELADFLRERLDEDEAMATAAEGVNWLADAGDGEAWLLSEDMHLLEGDPGTIAHIARHDPARALREVAAKRAILADHAPSEVEPEACRRCKGGMGVPCRTVRQLGATWSDHGDYRAEWAPPGT